MIKSIVNTTYDSNVKMLRLQQKLRAKQQVIFYIVTITAMTKAYQVDIKLTEADTGESVFSESYRIALRKEFVDNKTPKEHGFKNHVEGFLVQLKNNSKPIANGSFNKWGIYTVDLGIGVGSELVASRPCIVYKSSDSTL